LMSGDANGAWTGNGRGRRDHTRFERRRQSGDLHDRAWQDGCIQLGGGFGGQNGAAGDVGREPGHTSLARGGAGERRRRQAGDRQSDVDRRAADHVGYCSSTRRGVTAKIRPVLES